MKSPNKNPGVGVRELKGTCSGSGILGARGLGFRVLEFGVSGLELWV